MFTTFVIVLSLLQLAVPPQFKRYDSSSGLSNNIIHDVYQDSEGFLWVATENGLNRFDGHTFETFSSSLSDSTTISDNVVLDVFEDHDQNLWVGTWNGLNRFDRNTETFTHYTSIPVLGGYRIGYNDIVIDKEGKFWFPTSAGVCSFNPIDNSYTIFDSDANGSSLFMDEGEYTIFKDSEETVWVYNQSTNYLSHFDSTKKQLAQSPIDQRQAIYPSYSTGNIWTNRLTKLALPFPSVKVLNSFAENPDIEKVLEDRDGNLWIGTQNGVYLQQITSSEILNVSGTTFGTGSLSYFVEQIYEDKWGGIWVGTRNGLFYYDPLKKPFHHLSLSKADDKEPTSNIVMSVETDDSGLWIGTLGSGLYRYDLESKSMAYHRISEKTEANQIWDVYIHPSKDNELWLGTTDGLYVYQPEQRKATRIPFLITSPELPITFSIISGGINSILVAGDHHIYKVNTTTQEIIETISFLPDMSVSTVQDLLLKDDILHISTQGGGLLTYNLERNQFEAPLKNNSSLSLLSEFPIWDIHADSKEAIWLASGSGLFSLNSERDLLTQIESPGFTSNVVFFSISEDGEGNLWLGSDNGLFQFSPEDSSFNRYDQTDGLINTEFNRRASTISNDGVFWFGGTDGVSSFIPSEITANPFSPIAHITSLNLFDSDGSQAVDYKSDKPLSFTWHDNTFEIGFTGITFTNPDRVEYKYMLANHDPDWVSTRGDKLARYSKLPPGEYTFRVTASNSDGVWSSVPFELPLVIHPPFWKTWWAYLSYLFTALLGVALFIRWRTGSLEKDRRKLEIKVSERTKELEEQKELAVEARRKIEVQAGQLKELDEMKSRFFANISHELRTPLTLIDAPLQQVLAENLAQYPIEKLEKKLQGIQRNSHRLSKLIDELLDLSRLKENSIEIDLKQVNLRTWFTLFVDSYQSLAQSKGISFRTRQDIGSTKYVLLDVEKFDKVTSNLINNALKFTETGDYIEIALAYKEEKLAFSVSDSGMGISGEELPKVFDRFYKGASGEGSFTNGLGLGLSLSKELTELMNGSISVESSLSKGSVFTLSIPVQVIETFEEETGASVGIKKQTRSGTKMALIVEDNTEMREFLVQLLEPEFDVFEAGNGEEALQVLKNISPNLIISDLMMPKMDGLELTQTLRSFPNSAHIPILMLTARATDEDRLHSLRIGVDDYLSKPFIPEEVKVRAVNLAENHLKRIALNAEVDSSEPTPEEKELFNIQQIIEEQLDKNSLNVISLANDLHTSERQLYRTIQRLTGMTPNEYITSIRLNQARKILLKDKSITVDLVAQQIGFKSRSHFSRLFKKAYGLSPGKFQSEK